MIRTIFNVFWIDFSLIGVCDSGIIISWVFKSYEVISWVVDGRLFVSKSWSEVVDNWLSVSSEA